MASEYPAAAAAAQSAAQSAARRARPPGGRALGVAAALGVGGAVARLAVHLVVAAHLRDLRRREAERQQAGPQAGSTQR